MSRFWNERTRALTPYVPGEQPAVSDLIKLNTNEHPFAPSSQAVAVLERISGDSLRRYPDPSARELCSAIAQAEGVARECVHVGNGSDEVLAMVFMALFDEATPVTVPDITYSFYPVWASLYRVPLVSSPLKDDFTLNMSELVAAEGPLLIANPNAPTGIALSRDAIETLVQSNPARLVVVDEAYYGFGAETAAPLVSRYDNLLVTRTLSKSHALAGLRVGYAIACPELIEGLVRVKDSFNSYPIDAIAQAVAAAAIADSTWLATAASEVSRLRNELAEALRAAGFEVLPSQANFLFVQHPSTPGEQLFEALRRRNILVRRWNHPRIGNWLRITVGTEAGNNALIVAIKEALASD